MIFRKIMGASVLALGAALAFSTSASAEVCEVAVDTQVERRALAPATSHVVPVPTRTASPADHGTSIGANSLSQRSVYHRGW